MIRYALTFLGGAMVPTIAIYATGGSERTVLLIGLLLGMLFPLTPILMKPKETAKMIWSVSHSVEDVWARFRHHEKEAGKDLGRRQGDRSAAATAVAENPIVGDVVMALVNLNVEQKKAEKIVKELMGNMRYERFEDLFKDAVEASRKVVA